MTWHHSPWPLFGSDLDLARSWIRHQLRDVVSIQTGHLAISLGMGEELFQCMQSGAVHADPNAVRQWSFRLARLRREANPYRWLLPDGLFEQSIDTLTKGKLKGITLGVELNGGIGDHLEALSLLMPWARSLGIHMNLVMSKERQQQIKPLLPQCEKIQCVTKIQNNAVLLPVMALRAALMDEKIPVRYSTWTPKRQFKEKNKSHYLCCWRAEGIGDKFSAHSRSIPWANVHNFYQNILIHNHQSCIIDITSWKKWEAAQLEAIGVTVMDPRKGSLLDLIEKCQISRVVTIDTALAHLCAASGCKADVLLNIFADERWHELHKPMHNYGQLLKLWRSSCFGSWADILASLSDSLTSSD